LLLQHLILLNLQIQDLQFGPQTKLQAGQRSSASRPNAAASSIRSLFLVKAVETSCCSGEISLIRPEVTGKFDALKIRITTCPRLILIRRS